MPIDHVNHMGLHGSIRGGDVVLIAQTPSSVSVFVTVSVPWLESIVRDPIVWAAGVLPASSFAGAVSRSAHQPVGHTHTHTRGLID